MKSEERVGKVNGKKSVSNQGLRGRLDIAQSVRKEGMLRSDDWLFRITI